MEGVSFSLAWELGYIYFSQSDEKITFKLPNMSFYFSQSDEET
jgi:hypothetical protein